jgi:hypothetical protein
MNQCMGELMHWFFSALPQVVESGGIICGLCFTAFALRADSRSRQADILMRITEGHRQLWLYFEEHRELARVLDPKANLQKKPISSHEQRFVQLLINHLIITHQTSQLRIYEHPDRLGDDIRRFFSMPIPRAVWEKTMPMLDADFVAFVEWHLKEQSSAG